MKRGLLFLLFFVFAGAGVRAQVQDTSKHAVLTFETELINYGTILKGSNGVREFKFKNTGDAPLLIHNVQSSCGCLVPSWSKEPVMPGGTGTIKVTYDTQRVGLFEKTLTVTSNSVPYSRVIRIKGMVLMQNKEDEKKQGDIAPLPKNPHE